ncbi:MAG TPA: DUF4185 domain-containing protein [Thermoanaerobaculia bacterium]|nr:DUF4185 domain-containing protein [Thermoanaerobaculia bacterium]
MIEAPRVQSVRFIGSAHAGSGAGWTLHGQDGGQSIALGGETLFVFSDTLLSRSGQQLFLANCAALSGEPTLDGAMSNLRYLEDEHGLPREILGANPLERMAGFRFWPQHGIAEGDDVLLFYLGIHQYDQRSAWGFRMSGSGMARLDPRTGASERITRAGVWCLWPGDGDVRIGTQVLRADAFVYVFGSRASHAIVARVPSSSVGDPDAYRFLAADERWSESVSDAVSIAKAAPEFSVSFNEHLGAYLMVYADGFARELYVRTAPAVCGPYGPAVAVGRLPHRDSAEMVALAFEHPRFAKNGGKTVVVSYCQPHFTQNSLVAVTFA